MPISCYFRDCKLPSVTSTLTAHTRNASGVAKGNQGHVPNSLEGTITSKLKGKRRQKIISHAMLARLVSKSQSEIPVTPLHSIASVHVFAFSFEKGRREERLHTEAEGQDVRHGKTEQIEVCRRVHGTITCDNNTRGYVADDACQ